MSVVANQVLDRCGSTNDLARELGEQGSPHGSWISARSQEKGRGRLGREWRSVEGNLFLSMIARVPADKALWTWVPLATAVAVGRYLTGTYPALDFRIKWPNDLWIGQSKLGGILCEAVGGRECSFIIIGLGLNCVYAPQGLDQATISLTQALAPCRVQADDVRIGIIQCLIEVLDELAMKGSRDIVRDYERWAAFKPGTAIKWGERRSGTVKGLGPLGELLVESAEGALCLYAEDVTLLRQSCGAKSEA